MNTIANVRSFVSVENVLIQIIVSEILQIPLDFWIRFEFKEHCQDGPLT
jgi:hypothetical protein